MYIRGWARKDLLLEMCMPLTVIRTGLCRDGTDEPVGSLPAVSVDSGLTPLKAVGSRRQKNKSSRRCKVARWERDLKAAVVRCPC